MFVAGKVGSVELRVAIIGTRKTPNDIAALVLEQIPREVTEIVSGGSDGVDTAAEQVAALLSLPIRVFLPDYSIYGKQAPLKRNIEIVNYCDTMIAFWDGQSHGTRHTIIECLKRGKPVRIIPIQPVID